MGYPPARGVGPRRVGLLVAEHVEEEQADADADRRVGDVERRPVVAGDGEVEEVDDVAEADAVEQVADGAAEDQRQADLEPHALVRGAQRVGRDDQEDDDGDAVQEDRLDRGVDRGEEAERGAGVADVGQVEDVGDRSGGTGGPPSSA